MVCLIIYILIAFKIQFHLARIHAMIASQREFAIQRELPEVQKYIFYQIHNYFTVVWQHLSY